MAWFGRYLFKIIYSQNPCPYNSPSSHSVTSHLQCTISITLTVKLAIALKLFKNQDQNKQKSKVQFFTFIKTIRLVMSFNLQQLKLQSLVCYPKSKYQKAFHKPPESMSFLLFYKQCTLVLTLFSIVFNYATRAFSFDLCSVPSLLSCVQLSQRISLKIKGNLIFLS